MAVGAHAHLGSRRRVTIQQNFERLLVQLAGLRQGIGYSLNLVQMSHQYFARSAVSGITKPQDLALGKIVADELVDPLHIAHAGKRMTLHFEEILSIYAGDADGQSIDKRQVVLIFLDLDASLCWIAVDRDPYSAKLEPKAQSHDGVTRFMNGGALPVISFVRHHQFSPRGPAGLLGSKSGPKFGPKLLGMGQHQAVSPNLTDGSKPMKTYKS